MDGSKHRRGLARLGLGLCGAAVLTQAEPVAAQPGTAETVVIFRHGEKPSAGLGQLSCVGLNRALALPPVLAKQFGTPAALFAPDPADQIDDGNGRLYSYVRPLATIEPTAIALQMPVNTQFGYQAISDLQHALIQARYAGSTVFIAWEHGQITKLVTGLLQEFHGSTIHVPSFWPEDDYDTIYIVKISESAAGNPTATFSISAEGLNGEPATCSGPASPSTH